MKRFVLTVTAVLGFLPISASAQVFVFNNANQELLGLVANVAEGYSRDDTDSPIADYNEYWELYESAWQWLADKEAVRILKELLSESIIDRIALMQLGLIYRDGFTGLRGGFELPEFVSDPRIGRLVERLADLYADPWFLHFLSGPYSSLYQDALDGTEGMLEETGDVIIAIEEALSIPPPENFYNIFALFGKPDGIYSGAMQKTDGTRVGYIVYGLMFYEDEERLLFEINPDLFINMYAYSVVDNAMMRSGSWEKEFDRLYTPAVNQIAESAGVPVGQEPYVYSNSVIALSAYIFGIIGNGNYKDTLLGSYGHEYVYIEPLCAALEEHFTVSGQDFYSFFPKWFSHIPPAGEE